MAVPKHYKLNHPTTSDWTLATIRLDKRFIENLEQPRFFVQPAPKSFFCKLGTAEKVRFWPIMSA